MASTEAGFLQEIGINSIIFGAGDIKDANSINEKLDLKQFRQFQTILLDIIKDFCC